MPTKPSKPKRKQHRPHEGYEYQSHGNPPRHPALLGFAEKAQAAHRSWHVINAVPTRGGTIVETLLVGERGVFDVYQERPGAGSWAGTSDPERGVTRLHDDFAKHLKDYDAGSPRFFDLTGKLFRQEDLEEDEEG